MMRPPLSHPRLLTPTRLALPISLRIRPPSGCQNLPYNVRHSPRHRSLSTTSPKLDYRPRRSAFTSPRSTIADPRLRNPLDSVAAHRLEAERRAQSIRRMWFSAFGLGLCVIATFTIVGFFDIPSPAKTEAPPNQQFPPDAVGGERGIEFLDKAPTGASAVPWFPKTIKVPGRTDSTSAALPAGVGDAAEDYHLLGLGVRTVSFLRIKVYVVGLYVAASDMAALQAAFVRQAADVDAASTLVPAEKERLKAMLFDGRDSEIVWDQVLREAGVRSVIRVVPTRRTDWAHLRDGWVRAVEGRGKRKRSDVEKKFGDDSGKGEMLLAGLDEDDAFGEAVGRFKAIFSAGGRKPVDRGNAILLERDAAGILRAWAQTEGEKDRNKEDGFDMMGELRDERVSRLIWLGYLAGDNVASQAARENIVTGVMEAVGRPVGTLETQVV